MVRENIMHTILITGANRGIGFEATKQYAAAGWQVIACCRDLNAASDLKALANQFAHIKIIKLDVSSNQDITSLSHTLNHQPIDILFNNAGVWGPHGQILGQIHCEPWLEVFTINTIAPLLLAQALINNIAQSQLKIIAMLSSIMGSIADNEEGSHYMYRSSKAALNMVTKSLAHDLQEQQITVVSLNPGWVKTAMGGEHAPLSPIESVSHLKHLLARLTLSDSGKFFNYTGEEIPW